MILLDTNIVSEAMTREPHPRVRAWLDAQVAETLFVSSITVAELLFGVGALPAGRRKDASAGPTWPEMAQIRKIVAMG